MPRQLKPQPVGEPVADDVLGVEVQIFLDRNTLEFFATFEGVRIAHKEADEVRRRLEAAMKAAQSLSWIPVIQIAEPRGWRGDEFASVTFGFTLARYWLARKGDGYWTRAPWECENDGQRLSRCMGAGLGTLDDLKLPYTVGHSTSAWTLLEYSDETWAGLERIQAAIQEARARFQELLQTPAGIARLSAFGVPAVPQLSAAPSRAPLEYGETCPACQQDYNPADEAEDSDEGCHYCGMYIDSYSAPPPPDPDRAVELSSWDFAALKLIQDNPGTLTVEAAQPIQHLFGELKDRGLIVLDGAGQPFVTPKAINSIAAHDPTKDSNPPLILDDREGFGIQILRQQAPADARPSLPAGGAYAPFVIGTREHAERTGRQPSRGLPPCETCGGSGLTDKNPDGSPAPDLIPCWAFDCPVRPEIKHHPECPFPTSGACMCNALDADDARD